MQNCFLIRNLKCYLSEGGWGPALAHNEDTTGNVFSRSHAKVTSSWGERQRITASSETS